MSSASASVPLFQNRATTVSVVSLLVVSFYGGSQIHEWSASSSSMASGRSLTSSGVSLAEEQRGQPLPSFNEMAPPADEEEEEHEDDGGEGEDAENGDSDDRRDLGERVWPWCYKGSASEAACLAQSAKFEGNPCYWQANHHKCAWNKAITQPTASPFGVPGPPTPPPTADLSCIDNGDLSGYGCPAYPVGTLRQDWLERFTTSDWQCYYESHTILNTCSDVCIELFQTYTASTTWGEKTAVACRIGCGYAAVANGNKQQTCMSYCKNTVWHYDPGNQRCNWDSGLGIAVFEIDYFGAGKACEFGCIIGNQRDCPYCDRQAGYTTPGQGYYPFA